MNCRLSAMQEHELVQCCLAGEQAAWERLFEYCQQPLLRIIAHLLDAGPRSAGEAEELAADVWYLLLREGKRRLRLFDAQRGSLLHYLSMVARDAVARHYRRRAIQADLLAAFAQIGGTNGWRAVPDMSLWHEEFVATLTPRERWFWHTHMMGTLDCASNQVTPACQRKLKERILAKLRAYLACE